MRVRRRWKGEREDQMGMEEVGEDAGRMKGWSSAGSGTVSGENERAITVLPPDRVERG